MKLASLFASVLTAVCCFSALGQAPPLVPTSDPGVARAVLIDRPEIRVLRVEVQPGATRSMHTHTDVQYHLFSVIAGDMQVMVENQAPADAAPGKTFFFTPGTKHGFKNVGKTPAAAMEIFVRQSAVAPAPSSAAR